MRKSAFSLICALVVTMCACSGNEKTDEAQQYANTERDDSLRTALAEKDSLLSLFATISEGIYQIKEMENLLSVSNLSNESPSRKQEIINDIKLIKLDIESRRRSSPEQIEQLQRGDEKDHRGTALANSYARGNYSQSASRTRCR